MEQEFNFVSADGMQAIKYVPSGVYWKGPEGGNGEEKIASEVWERESLGEDFYHVRTDVPHG